MKIPRLALAALLAPVLAFAGSHPSAKSSKASPHAQTLQGFLVDNSCALEKHKDSDWAQKHGKACLNMDECRKSGYAVLTLDQQLYKFDAAGNAQARKLIDATDKKNDWKITVKGTLHPETHSVAVTTLALQP